MQDCDFEVKFGAMSGSVLKFNFENGALKYCPQNKLDKSGYKYSFLTHIIKL